MFYIDRLLTMILEERSEHERYALLIEYQSLLCQELETCAEHDEVYWDLALEHATDASYAMSVVVNMLPSHHHHAFALLDFFSDVSNCSVDQGWRLPAHMADHRVSCVKTITTLLRVTREALDNRVTGERW